MKIAECDTRPQDLHPPILFTTAPNTPPATGENEMQLERKGGVYIYMSQNNCIDLDRLCIDYKGRAFVRNLFAHNETSKSVDII